MKKIFTFLFAAFVTAFFTDAFAQQIPNPGFEAGTDTVSATSWNTINQFTSPLSIYPFTRTTSSHSGTYAAKLETKTVITSYVPGIVTLGTLAYSGGIAITGGIPFAYRPDTLKGFYKHPTASPDTAYIAVGLFKWNGSSRDTVAYATAEYTTQVSTYTPFFIKINYLSGVTPDSMNIAIISSFTHPGSMFFIDDLSFGYIGGVGVQPVDMVSNNFSVYPNPPVNQVFVNTEFNNSNPTTIKVYNVLGKVMYTTVNSQKKQNIDVSNYPVGLYFVEAVNNGKKHVQKITVNK